MPKSSLSSVVPFLQGSVLSGLREVCKLYDVLAFLAPELFWFSPWTENIKLLARFAPNVLLYIEFEDLPL